MSLGEKICNFFIKGGLYLLFFSVPLFFQGDTSELFEFNKMWLTFWLTLVIIGAWMCKMVIQKRIYFHRTIFDIPLVLFLISQIISTFISLDPYVSFWGYYSRFNGGLLSTITYIALFYAIVSNLTKKDIFRIVWISLISGVLVALWGLPSHFGYDPTCYLFRGTFDVSCWTSDFQPKIRIFSTIGQPDWMAAYLAVLLMISIAGSMFRLMSVQIDKLKVLSGKLLWLPLILFLTSLLFYIDLIFTNTRAGFAAFWIAFILFFVILLAIDFFKDRKFIVKFALIYLAFFGIVTFITGTPIEELNKFTLPAITASHPIISGVNPITSTSASSSASNNKVVSANSTATASAVAKPKLITTGITDSGKIRLYVWRGAIKAWEAHPLFGTGVETFAFAYYLYRPVAHNMTSEWDYLYNKAHNEFLNYLATTGIFGLGTFLTFVILYFVLSGRYVWQDRFNKDKNREVILTLAFAMAYLTIMITDFFGFSVVIINLFTFLFPALFLTWAENPKLSHQFIIEAENNSPAKTSGTSMNAFQWTGIVVVVLFVTYFELILFTDWFADKAYALGHNYDSVNQFQTANPYLNQAVAMRPEEPVFQDELSINEASLASFYLQNKDLAQAQTYATEAKAISDKLISEYPNNLLFFKSRARIFYLLAQGDPRILAYALQAIQRANQLAPTDAKILYNLGVLYGQTGDINMAIKTLEKTVKYKADYTDAYYALGLFYHAEATNSAGKVINQALQQKAVNAMQFILQNLAPTDTEVQKTLSSWNTGN